MESDAELLLNQATVLRVLAIWQVAAKVAIRRAQAERAAKAREEKGDEDASDFKIY